MREWNERSRRGHTARRSTHKTWGRGKRNRKEKEAKVGGLEANEQREADRERVRGGVVKRASERGDARREGRAARGRGQRRAREEEVRGRMERRRGRKRREREEVRGRRRREKVGVAEGAPHTAEEKRREEKKERIRGEESVGE